MTRQAGLRRSVAGARADLAALQAAGVDAVMFGNENDRPYELQGRCRLDRDDGLCDRPACAAEITVPFGVNVLWDPMATMALAAATGAAFVREIFTGTYASDMGLWTPDAGAAMRYRSRLGAADLAMLYNVSAEFADCLDRAAPARPGARRRCFRRSRMRCWCPVRSPARRPGWRIWRRSSGCCPTRRCWPIPASSMPRWPMCCGWPMAASWARRLKMDGDTWNAVDPDRAEDFMDRARAARGGRDEPAARS